jgi:hypothetical protein
MKRTQKVGHPPVLVRLPLLQSQCEVVEEMGTVGCVWVA